MWLSQPVRVTRLSTLASEISLNQILPSLPIATNSLEGVQELREAFGKARQVKPSSNLVKVLCCRAL